MSSSRHGKAQCGYEGCGSTRFNLGDDGYTYCHRGHQQSEIGTVVAEDTGELIVTGKKSRRRDSDAESLASRASGFHGPKAFEHYLLCLQLVLRKQLRWFIDTQRLPEQLETLARDLWALRLHKLQSRVSYDSETETEGQSQFFSSQSEGETSASEASRRRKKRASVRTDGSPNIRETLCLCYTGALLMREPITVADLFTWINEGRLLFYRAAKEVPLGMLERLPATYQELLAPQRLSKPEKLHQSLFELLSTFSSEFGMVLPPLNTPLVLYRWVRELALPVEVYAATQRLSRALEEKFSFNMTFKARSAESALRHPELRLMALLVAATKLLFPFDDTKRYPASAKDLSALSLQWPAWQETQSRMLEQADRSGLPSYKKMMDFSQTDVLESADDRLDEYMDWYEQNIASGDVREHGQAGKETDFRRALFRLFPAGRGDGPGRNDQSEGLEYGDDHISEALREVQSALKPKRVVEVDAGGNQVNRAGSFYRRHRIANDLEGPARMFHERAAALAGVSLDTMVRAVFLIEGKALKHQEKLRRGGDSSSEAEGT